MRRLGRFKVSAPSLISQLDHAGITWKAYLQALPHPDYQGICYPAKCNGAPDSDPLYVSKHDAIQNFTTSWNPYDWSRQVPIAELASDLKTTAVPRFSYIVPDECHDMHGDPPYCLDCGNIGDPQNQHLVAVGDAYLGALVSEITHARSWAEGNNAIIITFDNGDNSEGCCDGVPGGGPVATVVVTSHGPRGITDHLPANHYSTLRSIEDAFGLGCLRFACDTKHVTPLSDLLAVTGSKAVATRVLPELSWPTPTPSQPDEPLSLTPKSPPPAGGWSVQRAQLLGTSDNSVGAIAGSSPADAWAVGDYLPDAKNSNQDATLTFAEHWNGKDWTVVRTPNDGPDFNSFYGLAAKDGEAWAVGERLNGAYQDRALVEVWNGHRWYIANTPDLGSVRDMIFGAAALSRTDVWVVGDQEGGNGVFETLAEHWNGHRWPVVPAPASVSASVLLDGVTAADGRVWTVGESDSPTGGGKPLAESYAAGRWSVPRLPAVPHGANWSNLYAIVAAEGSVWAAGTYVDPATDNNNALVLRESGGAWALAATPRPGSGSNLPGGITAVDGRLWLAGIYDDGGSRLPLIERR